MAHARTLPRRAPPTPPESKLREPDRGRAPAPGSPKPRQTPQETRAQLALVLNQGPLGRFLLLMFDVTIWATPSSAVTSGATPPTWGDVGRTVVLILVRRLVNLIAIPVRAERAYLRWRDARRCKA